MTIPDKLRRIQRIRDYRAVCREYLLDKNDFQKRHMFFKCSTIMMSEFGEAEVLRAVQCAEDELARNGQLT